MIVRFSKSRQGPVLTCIREDGSVTGIKPRQGAFFVRHDLMHYAVETTLGLREGFYGLVAGGKSIDHFSAPGVAKTLPSDAIHAEFIVGLFDQITSFEEQPTAERVNSTLRQMLDQGCAPEYTAISADDLQAILARFNSLLVRYYELPDGGQMEMPFPIA